MPGERRDWPQFPFCSPRCKTIDLGRWLGGTTYGVPVEGRPEDDSGDAEAPDADRR
jgi:endogenous inhibitor of DNA gyrase (YacG/DUF329 family)